VNLQPNLGLFLKPSTALSSPPSAKPLHLQRITALRSINCLHGSLTRRVEGFLHLFTALGSVPGWSRSRGKAFTMTTKSSIRRALSAHRGSPNRQAGVVVAAVGLMTVTALILTTVTGMAYAASQPAISLGTASSFAVIGDATVTNGGTTTTLTGGTNVGTASTSITGEDNFNRVDSGATHAGDGVYTSAHNDLMAARADIRNLGGATVLASLPAGTPVTPGIYQITAAIGVTTDMTFDAQSNPDAVFVIRGDAGLNTTASTHVSLVNGAKACNIFWVTVGAVTLGASSTFAGRLIADAAVTLGAGVALNGQALSTNAAVNLSGNTINNSCGSSGTPSSSPSSPPPAVTTPTLEINGGATLTRNRLSTTTRVVSGTSDAFGQTVSVSVQMLSPQVFPPQLFRAVVGSNGEWFAAGLIGLFDGIWDISATVTDSEGDSATATQTLTLDTVDPTLEINGGAAVSPTSTSNVLSGTSNAYGRTVTATVAGVAGATETSTVSSTGAWFIYLPAAFANGVNTVTAVVDDEAGNTATATQQLTVNVPAPTVTIDGGSTALTNKLIRTVSGTSDTTGATITFTVDSNIFSTTVSTDGKWSVPGVVFTAGATSVVVTATNAGRTKTASQIVTVDVTAPTLEIIGGATATAGSATVAITGKSDAVGRVVTVTLAGATSSQSAIVDGDGNWIVAFAGVSNGTHSVTATVSDAAGNTTTATQEVTVDAPYPILTIDGGGTVLTNSPTRTLSGTSDAFGMVVVVRIGFDSHSAVVDTEGKWSIPDVAFDEGEHTLQLGVTSTVSWRTTSTSQTLTVDLTAPQLAFDNGATATETSDPTPVISGTSDAIGREVLVDDGEWSYSAVVTVDKTWSVNVVPLEDGVHTITAHVSDLAGNSTTAVQTLTVAVPAPTITFDDGAEVLTNAPTRTVSGTSDTAGATVSFAVEGIGYVTVVDEEGFWSVSDVIFTEGVTIVDVEISNNYRFRSASQTVTVDTTAPGLTVTGGLVAVTLEATPVISGTSDLHGGTVTIVVDGTIFTAVVDADGNWSVDVGTFSDGEHTVEATVVDHAGNRSTVTQTLTVDATAPTISVDGGAESSTADETPTISGRSGVIGGLVTVTIGDETVTATVNSLGVWSVESPAFATGVHTATVSVTDSRGRSVTARQALNYLFAPAAVIVNTTGAQTIRQGMRDMIDVAGDGFTAGESVEIWLHSTPVMLGTATADSGGHITARVRDTVSTPAGVHHIVLVGATSGTSGDSLKITVAAASASASTAGALAFTGTEPALILLVALLLLLVGGNFVAGARRRKVRRS